MIQRDDWPEDWPERLHAHIDARIRAPFEWGKNDCAHLAFDWVRDMTGHDPLEVFRGRYSTAEGSLRALKRLGKGGLVETFAALMPEEIGVRKARRGDVAVANGDEGAALGLVTGSEAIFFAPEGATLFPVSRCRLVWPVG